MSCVQASKANLFKGAGQGSVTQWHMTLVACFATGRVNDTEDCVSTFPCSVALLWSSAQLRAYQVSVLGAPVANGIENRSAEVSGGVVLSCVVCIGAGQMDPATPCCKIWTQ